MVTILPAVLATSEQEYREEIKKASALTNFIHIDFVDGKFADSKTVSLDVVKKFKTRSSCEAHLMVCKPSEYVSPLLNLGFKRIILPMEGKEPLEGFIQEIKNSRVGVGLSLNPETPLSDLNSLIEEVDLILLLGVNPGFSGQELIPQVYKKIQALTDLVPPGVKIEIDGGVTEENAQSLVDAGADILTIGSHLINSLDPKKQLQKIHANLN